MFKIGDIVSKLTTTELNAVIEGTESIRVGTVSATYSGLRCRVRWGEYSSLELEDSLFPIIILGDPAYPDFSAKERLANCLI